MGSDIIWKCLIFYVNDSVSQSPSLVIYKQIYSSEDLASVNIVYCLSAWLNYFEYPILRQIMRLAIQTRAQKQQIVNIK